MPHYLIKLKTPVKAVDPRNRLPDLQLKAGDQLFLQRVMARKGSLLNRRFPYVCAYPGWPYHIRLGDGHELIKVEEADIPEGVEDSGNVESTVAIVPGQFGDVAKNTDTSEQPRVEG